MLQANSVYDSTHHDHRIITLNSTYVGKDTQTQLYIHQGQSVIIGRTAGWVMNGLIYYYCDTLNDTTGVKENRLVNEATQYAVMGDSYQDHKFRDLIMEAKLAGYVRGKVNGSGI